MLDDAYNYMYSRGLEGAHNTDIHHQSLSEQASKETNNYSRPTTESDPAKLLVFSAADEDGINRVSDAYQDYFRQHLHHDGRDYLARLAYTLSNRRSHLSWRSYALVDQLQGLKSLNNLLSKPMLSERENRAIAFIFTGQGAQYRHMGAELLSYDTFRSSISRFDKHLMELGCTWTVAELLRTNETYDVDEPEYSQPMTTALQIALYDLLEVFNVRPTAVMGHSSGEIAAAYAAGALSIGSACKVSYYRGKCASSLKQLEGSAGAMLSVSLSVEIVQGFLRKHREIEDNIHIACINSPCNVTLSGDEESIDSVMASLDTNNIKTRKLKTGVAYHSPHMKLVEEQYGNAISCLERNPRATKPPSMISTLTGQLVQKLEDICTPSYWVANMVSPVQFSEAMLTMSSFMGKVRTRKLGTPKIVRIQDLVEIGPHSALRRPILNCLRHGVPQANVRYSSVLVRDHPSVQTTLRLIGDLYSYGHPADIRMANENSYSTPKAQHALVDLPQYPFNHSKIYWHESNLSRHLRLRRASKHELLGTPVPEWNPLEPRWRKFFDLAETPWIGDHQVNGKAVYPAAGMITMAIEGLKQITDVSQPIVGFQLSDIFFSSPIPIKEESRVEAQLHMRAAHSSTEKDPTSFEFRVYSRTEEEWVRNCGGYIQILYGDQDNTFWRKESAFYERKYHEALQSCDRKVATHKMYDNFVFNGMNYKSAFQSLDRLAWDGGSCAIGDLKCFQWTPEYSRHDRQDHVVHPATLDAAGQLGWFALTNGAEDVIRNGLAVTRIHKAWVACSGLSYPDTRSLRAACTTSFKGLRGTDSTIFALGADNTLKLLISRLETTAVGGIGDPSTVAVPKQMCFEMLYKPDLDILSGDQLAALAKADFEPAHEPTSFYEELELVLLYFASKALEEIAHSDPEKQNTKPHLAKYVEWLKFQVHEYQVNMSCRFTRDQISRLQDPAAMQKLVKHVERADGELLVHVARNLSSIIQGRSDPLELLFSSGHAERYYEALFGKMACCKQLHNYLNVLSHKHPRLSILEVGAGTGSFTSYVLHALASRPERMSRYDYTDISESFFEQAREKFAGYSPTVTYGKLDIEKDPVHQDYSGGSYDVVVAGLVLHATSDLGTSIRNVRRLLKPRGKFILLEITEPQKFRTGVAFGTLPGWWLSTEAERKWSPCLSEEYWRDALMSHGFCDVNLVLRDYESDICHESSIIISTADDEPGPTNELAAPTLLIDPSSSLQRSVAKALRDHLAEQHGLTSKIVSVSETGLKHRASGRTLVFLVELDKPFLSGLDQASFEALQALLAGTNDVVWITASHKSAATWPDHQMIAGLSRVLNTEKPDRAFVTLQLEDHGSRVESYVHHAVQAIVATIYRKSEACELEYVEENGVLMINRVLGCPEIDQAVYSKTQVTTRYQELGQAPPLSLTIANPGILESIVFQGDDKYHMDLGEDDLEIQVQAVGVNFHDLFVLLGKLDSTAVGCDCAGIVTRIGSNCKTVAIGDRVCATIIGCCKTYARCNSQLVVKVPDGMTFKEAASIPVPGVTAHYSLYTMARLQPGESILIHSAAGGTGQMMLQVAQAIGARVYVTVGTEKKKQLLQEVYGVPETHIFNSRDLSFERDITCATDGMGVDVVVNSLSGRGLLASWACVAPCGRFIELGKSDIQGNTRLPMNQFEKNVAFHAVAVDFLSEARPLIVSDALRSIMAMVSEGRVKLATPLMSFSISETENAFRLMQSGKNMGKMVLTMNPSDVVPVRDPRPFPSTVHCITDIFRVYCR